VALDIATQAVYKSFEIIRNTVSIKSFPCYRRPP